MSTLNDEIARPRIFAIISQPDAGKTSLTEKLLLFGGAIQLAGEVNARAERRRARWDRMAVERERGISVSSRRWAGSIRALRATCLATDGAGTGVALYWGGRDSVRLLRTPDVRLQPEGDFRC